MHTTMLRRTPCLLRNLASRPSVVCNSTPRYFSTMLQQLESMDTENSVMKTMSVSPLGDTAADKNKFYEISDEQFSKSFPTGVDSNLQMLFARLSKKRLMIRETSLKLISLLKQEGNIEEAEEANDEAPLPQVEKTSDTTIGSSKLVVLSASGKKQPLSGVGKTTALMHAIHWARSTGWIVFHVQGRELMTGGFWITPSQDVQGQFDQPQVATAILKDLVDSHSEQLSQIQSDNQAEGSLLDLVQEGLKDEDIATNIVIRVLTQVKAQTDVPVMVAVDGFNLLFEETEFQYSLKPVTADEFRLVRAFRGLTMCGSDVLPENSFPSRGLVVATESNKYPRSKKLDYYANAGSMLWKQGVKRIPVSNMSSEETDAFMDFFRESDILTTQPGEDPVGEARLIKMQSQCNPRALVSRIAMKF